MSINSQHCDEGSSRVLKIPIMENILIMHIGQAT